MRDSVRLRPKKSREGLATKFLAFTHDPIVTRKNTAALSWRNRAQWPVGTGKATRDHPNRCIALLIAKTPLANAERFIQSRNGEQNVGRDAFTITGPQAAAEREENIFPPIMISCNDLGTIMADPFGSLLESSFSPLEDI